jgi:phospholipid/cholesterol/gamma-HCH transport system substrate-binding protein
MIAGDLRRAMRATEVRGVVLTLACIGLLVGILALTKQESTFRVQVNLPEATGLREGTLVRVAGAVVGKIGRLRLGAQDAVIADLDLTKGVKAVGSDASVKIETANLLGESVLELDPGHPGQMPAPANFTIPAGRVSSNVQLDQVLDVLDAPTRARLAVLINEAGYALTGRGGDFAALLSALPSSLDASTSMLDELVSDNRTLGLAVAHSDRFITQFAQQGHQLTRMVDVTGQTMGTFAARQRELGQTLTRAPGTLQTLQRFLEDLRQTTTPLGPAAAAITATAPQLSDTLAALQRFRTAAAPALHQATVVAPALTRLADQATPVLAAAAPTLASGASLFGQSPAVMSAFDHGGIDDLLGFMEGWARAIQTRDGISHVFRGRVLIGADAMNHLLESLSPPKTAHRPHHAAKPSVAPTASTPSQPATPVTPGQKPVTLPGGITLPTLPPVPQIAQQVLGTVTGALGGGNPPAGGGSSQGSQQNAAQKLLNLLLGP